jgi:hypothetical protein
LFSLPAFGQDHTRLILVRVKYKASGSRYVCRLYFCGGNMLAVIDHRLPLPCQASLKRLGFTLLPLPLFPRLSSPVASHPDMLLLRVKDTLFCHREYYEIAKHEIDQILCSSGLSLCLTEDPVGEAYPKDIALNFVFTGNYLLGKTDCMSEKVKEYAKACRISLLSVTQGYAKCSSVILSDALITADTGIASAAASIGWDALLVSPGDVSLPPYSYGFLGGASGVCGRTVFFCGDLHTHKDSERINAFCRKHGYEIVSLSKDPLFDGGSILFF